MVPKELIDISHFNALKILNFICVRLSLNITPLRNGCIYNKISFDFTAFYIVFHGFTVKVGCSNYSVSMVMLIISIDV